SIRSQSHCHCSPLLFFTHTATSASYPLSLHDALPISPRARSCVRPPAPGRRAAPRTCAAPLLQPAPVPTSRLTYAETWERVRAADRKSTRLNSSHVKISYAVFCLKKKNKQMKYR